LFYIFTEHVSTGLLKIVHPVVRISGDITDIRIHPLGSKIYGSYFFKECVIRHVTFSDVVVSYV